MHQRLAPLWAVVLEAAPGDPQLRSVIDELNQRRVGHMRLMVENLAAAGRLRPGLSTDVAADVLWATNSPEFFSLLVRDRGWPPEAFQRWLAEARIDLLLSPDSEGRGLAAGQEGATGSERE
jgi:hypothetical protein